MKRFGLLAVLTSLMVFASLSEGRQPQNSQQTVLRGWLSDEGCDAALLSHVVEVFSPAKVQKLYKTAYESLPARGRLFIWTILANDQETGALQAAKSSIYFLCVASGEGMAHPAKEHKELMKAAGFRSVKIYSAAKIDHGALVATK